MLQGNNLSYHWGLRRGSIMSFEREQTGTTIALSEVPLNKPIASRSFAITLRAINRFIPWNLNHNHYPSFEEFICSIQSANWSVQSTGHIFAFRLTKETKGNLFDCLRAALEESHWALTKLQTKLCSRTIFEEKWVLFCLCPPPPLVSAYFFHTDARAIFLHNELQCNGSCCVIGGCIIYLGGGGNIDPKDRKMIKP